MDASTWAQWVGVLREGGAIAVLLGVIYGLAAGRLFTQQAYQQLVADRDEWKQAYRGVADFAIRQQQEARR